MMATEPSTPRTILVTVYKGQLKPDTYLYVREASDLGDLPQHLLDLLGSLEKVLSVELHETRALAQADVREVIAQIVEHGFYLQLPPPDNQYVDNELARL